MVTTVSLPKSDLFPGLWAFTLLLSLFSREREGGRSVTMDVVGSARETTVPCPHYCSPSSTFPLCSLPPVLLCL